MSLKERVPNPAREVSYLSLDGVAIEENQQGKQHNDEEQSFHRIIS